MPKYPKVSIIIPLYIISDRFFRDFLKFDDLNYPNIEILVVCDQRVHLPKLKKAEVKQILTNQTNTGPAEKRDIAIKKAKGKICAFIDDDAYPHRNWIKTAIKHFRLNNVVAVGGTGLTPPEDSLWERLGGKVYESIFVSAGFRERFILGKNKKKVYDWPAYNLFVRKDVIKRVGGYGSYFYGGEDTFLCLKLLRHGEIIYEPQAYVYHHRRPLFSSHLKQIYNVGVHRGYFAKVFPQTSRVPVYFIPTILNIGLVTLIIGSVFSAYIFSILIVLLSLFILMPVILYIGNHGIVESVIISLGIVLTHIVYGLGFVKGLLILDLKK